jgi:hypothetical protein
MIASVGNIELMAPAFARAIHGVEPEDRPCAVQAEEFLGIKEYSSGVIDAERQSAIESGKIAAKLNRPFLPGHEGPLSRGRGGLLGRSRVKLGTGQNGCDGPYLEAGEWVHKVPSLRAIVR